MPNAWDVPSALLFKEAGFKSIATSSAVLAASRGIAGIGVEDTTGDPAKPIRDSDRRKVK
jgi:2-methylisocitrate lyase-like PEP mutase family enzyme